MNDLQKQCARGCDRTNRRVCGRALLCCLTESQREGLSLAQGLRGGENDVLAVDAERGGRAVKLRGLDAIGFVGDEALERQIAGQHV